ncbi:hypothetical protein HDF11_002891 [Tunturiibacter psychrotolerans]
MQALRGRRPSLGPRARSGEVAEAKISICLPRTVRKTGDVTLLSEIKVMGAETYAIGQSVSNAFLLTGKKLTL